ncbi:YhgE/Pip domain-containing protein [Microbacterium telephonicum]|uniref:Putative membrane protein n=1 Tax=Microbacterium telephonicum TaxID=1714841 RepID=A0A498CIW4_9MICO|nr:YhgE/Pip domain-containing protein [Microbacterium telephonicum]RLK52241.1 putative membrane protein [Microbacterium telephonicum]
MKDILRLTRRDLRHATSNVMAIVVLFGLVVIPSLFTWFNVIASWDPFSNTKNLKVAVASTDAGYESDLIPVRINVGEQVISALRANDDLEWVFTTEEDAIDGTRSGDYYAALVLPESFSADMLTFFADGGERTSIAYYTNQKKNALAPKVTDQGAEGVSTQINEVFTETISEVALGLVSSLSDYLTDADTQLALTRLESNVGAVATQLRAGAQTADMFTALIQSTIPLVDSADALIDASRSSFQDVSGAVGSGSDAVDSLTSTLTSASSSLSAALAQTASGYDAVATSIDALFSTGDSLTSAQVDVIDTLADRVQTQIDEFTAVRSTLATEIGPLLPESAQPALATLLSGIDTAIARQQVVHASLAQAGADLAAGNQTVQSAHTEISAVIAEAKQAIQDAQDAYSSGLQPQLDQLSSTLSTIGSDVSSITSDLAAISSDLSGGAATISGALTEAQTATEKISTGLEEAAANFDTLAAALASAADTGDLSALEDAIGSDPSVLATSLAEPIAVERTAVFSVVSFGAAMAPLYVVLALWVGSLLMTVAIRVDVKASALPDRPELSPTQKYLGRYGVFSLLGLAQSTLIALGLILFIQVQAVHPFLLLLACWITSLVFTLISYTFVVAFGNAGKALSVLLLVIQISGSGGAYPLQLLPTWFQNISPYLPATHAINAIRAAIAGIYAGDYWISLGLLLLFLVPILLLGLVLRRPLIAFNRGLAEAIESTKLM